jgi:hypothetical protein
VEDLLGIYHRIFYKRGSLKIIANALSLTNNIQGQRGIKEVLPDHETKKHQPPVDNEKLIKPTELLRTSTCAPL